jgi:hypothetical protein
MEKKIKRIEIAVFLLLGVSVINMLIFFTDKFTARETNDSELTVFRDLPSDLSREFLDQSMYKIKTAFNRSDWEAVYSVFGDYARAQLSVDEIEHEFKKLKPALGNIGTYAYSHYIFEGEGNNAEWFEIQYKCRFDNGKGTVKISTRTVEGVSEIIGVNIFLSEL